MTTKAKPKTILVTGCSAGGVGAAVAIALATKGHCVFATARDLNKIPPELVDLPTVATLLLDVTCTKSIVAAATVVANTTGAKGDPGLDVLINNAGLGYTVPLLDTDFGLAQQVYETNVWGPLKIVQSFADLLIKKKGRLVNICSISSVLHMPWMGIYASSKAAMTVISDTLRLELAPFGVSVTTVVLGIVATGFNDNKLSLMLPPRSRYASIRDTILGWRSGDIGPKGCTPSEAAASLLPDILGCGKTGTIWRGDKSLLVKLLSAWTPEYLLDTVVARGQGLDTLAQN
ncbi:NADPH-dependent 1-acyl dihydroxyacetone phosphate reductase [Fusarium torreyae]|uniref:NADPH-dependent 1-acyl dihydroxyacetone phosphate reductase n=1 Tax=Fusarium torreyae TaxID=1237075 RepID=A0A9W8RPA9_9HYPO|nr:NADPH-dependent 1-acyl dihydroxyacetone phosphate reductase [Fusarium torreyae]